MNRYFDFESDVEKIDIQINKLNSNDNNYNNQKTKLLEKKNFLLKKIYSNLSAWEKVQVARHANRPHALDYINLIFKNIVYLHGDKNFQTTVLY